MTGVLKELQERFGSAVAVDDRQDSAVVLNEPERLLPVLDALRSAGFTFLTDLTGIDYLQYPAKQPGRFAVVYLLHDLERRRRMAVKVFPDTHTPVLPSATAMWKSANWLERECWDQFGIRFEGHPNLKRILNHHEFVGHPLRKDYPMRARQPLSENDSLLDEMALRLRSKGILVPAVERSLFAPAAKAKERGEEAAPCSPSFGAG
ncbi:MAG: NADH-quinone oxidoreductase subunit C, partial [Cyanobacteria bacterium REEB65]|nr:NADH-quinone oxidoreductase subunit C [Cyanobacteria bacterium REEB65]